MLADNKISRIQLTTDDDGLTIQESDEQDPDWVKVKYYFCVYN